MEVSERNQGIFFIFINRWTDHDHTFTFLLSWFQFGPGTESCKLNDIKTEESQILIQDWSTRIPRLRLRFTICCWYQLFYAIKVPYGRFFRCILCQQHIVILGHNLGLRVDQSARHIDWYTDFKKKNDFYSVVVTGPVSRMQFYWTFLCLLINKKLISSNSSCIDQAGPLWTQLEAPKAPY